MEMHAPRACLKRTFLTGSNQTLLNSRYSYLVDNLSYVKFNLSALGYNGSDPASVAYRLRPMEIQLALLTFATAAFPPRADLRFFR